jgi:hypothetical protein
MMNGNEITAPWQGREKIKSSSTSQIYRPILALEKEGRQNVIQ